jgi:hypothetical protein
LVTKNYCKKETLVDGVDMMYLKSGFVNYCQAHFYYLNFNVTSFSNKHKMFKLVIEFEENNSIVETVTTKRILETPEFSLVARKNKQVDDNFWNMFLTNEKKKKSKIILRKRKKYIKYFPDEDEDLGEI